MGSVCEWCNGTDFLEYAHIKPTGLKGASRGMTRRYQDVLRHPDHYVVLCRECHRDQEQLAKRPVDPNDPPPF